MQITYNTKRIKDVCENAKNAIRTYGSKMADKIQQRIDEIKASDSIEDMIQYKIGRCHALKGTRGDQYAVDLVHPYRLIFKVDNNKIVIANIIEIVDYH